MIVFNNTLSHKALLHSSRKYPYKCKFQGGGEWQKQKFFYGAVLEFPEGWRGAGVQTKNPSMGGVWIFSRTTP